jgi:hypothetical protein
VSLVFKVRRESQVFLALKVFQAFLEKKVNKAQRVLEV